MGEAKRRGTFEQRRARVYCEFADTVAGLVDVDTFEREGRAALVPPACPGCGGKLTLVECQALYCRDEADAYHAHSRCGTCAGVFTTFA